MVVTEAPKFHAEASACLPAWSLLAGYGGRMAAVGEVKYWWHEAPVPAGLEVTQVCGYLLCPVTCRVLVQDDDGVFNLPGGTPEPEDGGDLVATLVREAFEEYAAACSGLPASAI
jgi:hypothetical protein